MCSFSLPVTLLLLCNYIVEQSQPCLRHYTVPINIIIITIITIIIIIIIIINSWIVMIVERVKNKFKAHIW